MLKGKGFMRHKLKNGWTIGYDIKNRAIIQFTKDDQIPGYKLIAGWLFSFTKASYGDGYRTWISIGWGQGFWFTTGL
ncbi:hypothetical protein [Magnetospirillum molischianum]|uniref:Uncharacterized protein n=1 Tax=Magnetospirillum molischianum DSM 120 TaxID=1150626 RepID=H8FY07_MAGML|nr:hypothetical protein [Magnetospirillum molischianum]CCG43245.1 hypothetical protein PHAMO_80036 [Magnetospirillum molischianum DSM 120]